MRSRWKTIRKNCDTSWLKNDRDCVQKCKLTRIWLEEKRIPKIWQVEMDIFLYTQRVHNNETFEKKKTISATKVFNCTAIIASDPYLWIFHHKAIGYNYCRTFEVKHLIFSLILNDKTCFIMSITQTQQDFQRTHKDCNITYLQCTQDFYYINFYCLNHMKYLKRNQSSTPSSK